MPPPAPREWRAAWIASVSNIDWPARDLLNPGAQRDQAKAMIERARAIGLNALILQVRPAGDALYASALEPWSEYLTGAQGRAPEPAWDPLAWWIEQAHANGLELQAWINPYRARHSSARSPLAAPHLGVAQARAVKAYGDQLWMDPGEPAAQQRTLAVVADLVRRYDLDAVHLDDYFYPYPVQRADGSDLPFPDDEAWLRQLTTAGDGAATTREDWRRANVDALVQALQRSVRLASPHTRLAISPFGLGRPDRRPPGIEGFSQYHRLYADVERWLAQAWCDELVPQLYWPIGKPAQAFAVLLDYWLANNPRGIHLHAGLFTSRIGAAREPYDAGEVLAQIALCRQRVGCGGQAHFSLGALMQDRDGIATRLAAGPYAQPALPPATPWLPAARLGPPAPPALSVDARGLRWQTPPASADGVAPAWRWAVWKQRGGQWRFAVQARAMTQTPIESQTEAVVVSAVDRIGRESARVRWQRG
jgi:uncharacterized lipoprotein YddW (UPF0748 family)